MLFLWLELLEAWESLWGDQEGFCHVDCLDAWGTVAAQSLVSACHGMNLVVEVFLGDFL